MTMNNDGSTRITPPEVTYRAENEYKRLAVLHDHQVGE